MPDEKLTQLAGVTLPLATTDLFYVVQDVSTTPASRKITLNDLSNSVSAGSTLTQLSPDAVANLVGWWKADAIVGLNDGDPVATWPDSASSPHDFTESTNKPTYKTNIINSLPVVRFDDTNDGMQSALSISHPFTMILVVSNRAAPSPGLKRWVQGQSNNIPFGLTGNTGGNANNVGYYNGNFTQSAGMESAIDNRFWIVTLTAADNDIRLYLSEKWVSTLASGTTTFGALALGASGQTTTQPANMDLAELMFYSRVLTADELNGIRWGLRHKYNISP